MSRWMYQMSEDVYSFKEFKGNVFEGKIVRWPIRRRMFAEKWLLPGDLLFCFYAPTKSRSPGICGFGIVLMDVRYRKFDWLPIPPTAKLTEKPWWDDEVRKIINSVRKNCPRGTMYQVSPEIDTELRHGLFKWIEE